MDGKYHYIVLFHHNRHLLSPVLSHYMEFSSSHGYHTSSYSSVKFSRVSRASRLVRLRLRLGLGLGFVSVMRKCGRVHFAVILESEVARLKIRGPHSNALRPLTFCCQRNCTLASYGDHRSSKVPYSLNWPS